MNSENSFDAFLTELGLPSRKRSGTYYMMLPNITTDKLRDVLNTIAAGKKNEYKIVQTSGVTDKTVAKVLKAGVENGILEVSQGLSEGGQQVPFYSLTGKGQEFLNTLK